MNHVILAATAAANDGVTWPGVAALAVVAAAIVALVYLACKNRD
jgi:hypothetical protein